ncbi:uncharacterized protein LOC127748826 [Frankliniella occidentalis]|uniref:Uncharacterized protein LOC127748826 n=1 Tax=Frankliniella occidentalis TaxID=133901 RepID=A0A9C6U1V0_FRAOC|nr:uncharacterized protein LOC127748826 [Frankliniella occidentalis]
MALGLGWAGTGSPRRRRRRSAPSGHAPASWERLIGRAGVQCPRLPQVGEAVGAVRWGESSGPSHTFGFTVSPPSSPSGAYQSTVLLHTTHNLTESIVVHRRYTGFN